MPSFRLFCFPVRCAAISRHVTNVIVVVVAIVVVILKLSFIYSFFFAVNFLLKPLRCAVLLPLLHISWDVATRRTATPTKHILLPVLRLCVYITQPHKCICVFIYTYMVHVLPRLLLFAASHSTTFDALLRPIVVIVVVVIIAVSVTGIRIGMHIACATTTTR